MFTCKIPISKASPTSAANAEKFHNEGDLDEDKDVDTIKLEDGPTVLAHQYVDPVLEKKLVRKLDLHVVPLVMALYLLAFLDRSNIGNARIAGMATDLHLTSDRYTWLLTIFYISYIIFEFQAMMWKIVPPHMWAALVVFGWGLVSTVQAAIHTWKAEMALRFFMGLTEAGYGPGIPYLLSFFYLRHELGFRCGIFLSAAPLANTFAGALAYGITSGHSKIANWRVLFLVEGLPTIVMAAVVFFFLPDSPDKARYLAEDEKRIAKARGVRQAGTSARVGGIDWKDMAAGLLDIKAWFTGLMYFSCNVSFSSLPVFLPTILNDMGFSAVNAQGLTTPPFFLSFLITIGTTWVADKTQQRGFMLIGLTITGGIGYIILACAKSVGARYFGVFMAAAGIFPSIANILPWVLSRPFIPSFITTENVTKFFLLSDNQGSDTRRGAGIVLLNLIGQCGPLLGTRLYPTKESPFYVKGQAICAAFMFFATVLAVGLRSLLVWENRKLDREFGSMESQNGRRAVEGRREVKAGMENYGPEFRYVL
ncbi:MFS general substrate transporter [Lepidopterella palustris CBS 459.81]|uniref:MFS general substrate transporter n=1 Tax=Lepidopterella palustris CBS 459.81 TaxID=1314670 RepID=A0A8E2JG33_9PEZI|nr:MFS general substrate transporter [Lepidopterella palustris CBS 459.81]